MTGCSVTMPNGGSSGAATTQLTEKSVHRPCSKTEFDELFQYTRPRKPGLCRRLLPKRCNCLSALFSFFPILEWLPQYQVKRDLLPDIMSGLTVAVMHIPQGMAYALLAGVAPIVGLYMAFFPVLLYIVMGTSRHISMGTFAVVCMMASRPITKFSAASDEELSESSGLGAVDAVNATASASYEPTEVATAICFVVGAWQVVLGFCRMGMLSVFMSDPLVSGFTTGAAVHVLTSQIKNMFGVHMPQHSGPFKIIYTYIDLVRNISTTNFVSLGISACFVTALMVYNEILKPRVAKKLPVPLPVELIAVVVGTVVSSLCHLEERHRVAVIGHIPTGLPAPKLAPFELIPELLIDGLLIGIVAFSVNMSMASIFARKLNYSVDANQELLASGFSNIFSSFFSCVPFAASLSRSLIQQTVGGKTQIASLVSCLVILLILLVIGPQFEPLPNCVLASIVIVALKGMLVQVMDVPTIWRHSRADGLVWIATFMTVVFIDIDYGLFIGISFSLMCVIMLGRQPKMYRLGQVPGTDIYLDFSRYQTALEIPHVCIIHISGGLHFANIEYVRKKVYRLVKEREAAATNIENTEKMKLVLSTLEKTEVLENETTNENSVGLLSHNLENSKVFCVIINMSSVCFTDPSSLKGITAVYEDLDTKNVLLCLAECSAQVYERMVNCDFFWKFPDTHLFPSVHDAVLYAHQTASEYNVIKQ